MSPEPPFADCCDEHYVDTFGAARHSLELRIRNTLGDTAGDAFAADWRRWQTEQLAAAFEATGDDDLAAIIRGERPPEHEGKRR